MNLNDIYQRFDRLESLLLAKKDVFTIGEFCRYAGLSKSAAYKLTSQRKIPFSCPNGKVIFISRRDADAYLQSNRVPSTYEINATAANYITLNPLTSFK